MKVTIDGKEVDVRRWKSPGGHLRCLYGGEQYVEIPDQGWENTNKSHYDEYQTPDHDHRTEWLDPPIEKCTGGFVETRKVTYGGVDLSPHMREINISLSGEWVDTTEGDSMNLYAVTLTGADHKIEIDKKVVAKDTYDAEFEAGVNAYLVKNKVKPSEVTVIVSCLGAVHDLED